MEFYVLPPSQFNYTSRTRGSKLAELQNYHTITIKEGAPMYRFIRSFSSFIRYLYII